MSVGFVNLNLFFMIWVVFRTYFNSRFQIAIIRRFCFFSDKYFEYNTILHCSFFPLPSYLSGDAFAIAEPISHLSYAHKNKKCSLLAAIITPFGVICQDNTTLFYKMFLVKGAQYYVSKNPRFKGRRRQNSGGSCRRHWSLYYNLSAL